MKLDVYLKILFLLLITTIALEAWDITSVDVGVDFDKVSRRAIAFDSSGHLHGVYGGTQLYHKLNSNIEVVDATIGSGEYPSLSIDSTDKLYILYKTHSNVLKCAIGTFGNYQITTIDSGIMTLEQKFSMDIDSSDIAHVTYIKDDHTLHHAWFDGVWYHETIINSGVNYTTSIIIDSSDNLHISFSDASSLKYIAKIAGSWQTPMIISSTSSDNLFSSIAVDSNDDIYVTYYASGTNNGDLMLAKKSGLSWNKITLVGNSNNSGWTPSLAIDGTTCYISYRETDNSNGLNISIKYLSYDGTSIQIHNVDTILEYGFSSLTFYPNSSVYILYDYDGETIKKYDGSILSYAKESDMGHDIAIATDSNNYLHVSYTDAISSTLRYATNAPSGSWNVKTVTGAEHVAETAIAVDSNGNSHICFYNRSTLDLKYASNSSGAWNVATVASSGDIGGTDGVCDIALDSNNNVYISYYDSSNETMRYATNSSGSWISSAGETGSNAKFNAIAINQNDEVILSDPSLSEAYVDIAVDSNNVVHKTYFYGNGINYRNTLGNAYNFGFPIPKNHSRLAVDDSQNAYISFYNYYSDNSQNAKIFTNATGVWLMETVNVNARGGAYASIALDNDSKLNVCYHNADTKALDCASKTLDLVTDALSSFYYATNGAHWINKTNWFSGDKCTWYGVYCDASGNVNALILKDNNLTGALPNEIKNLPLSSLDLGNNHINDISKLSALTSLQDLNISTNDITDISALSALANLISIDISNNAIASLEAIKNLIGLNNIYANNTGLTSLPQFSAMNLCELSLNNNNLVDFTNLDRVSQLHNLSAESNQISDISALSNFQLWTLYLSSNSISDISALSLISTLTTVDFSFNEDLNDISALSNSTNLYILNLVQTHVSDISPLVNFTHLKYFHGTKLVSISDITPLSTLVNMQDLSIWLRSGEVTDLTPLSGMHNMKNLFISGGDFKDLSPLSAMDQIKELTLRYCEINDISPLKNLTTLTRLNLQVNYLRNISALSNLALLESVNLEYNCIHDFTPVSGVPHVDGIYDQRSSAECMAFMPSIIMYLLSP